MRRRADSALEAPLLRWGLVPFWAKDARGAARLINARSETVATTPAFREAFRTARCLVPVSGFYEWVSLPGPGKAKQPHWIHAAAPTAGPLTLAGLWASWRGPDPAAPPLETFTILTTAASADVANVHDRMPVLVPPAHRERWLDPAASAASLAPLLAPAPPGTLRHHPVGPAVSNVRADGPALIAPLGGPVNLRLDL